MVQALAAPPFGAHEGSPTARYTILYRKVIYPGRLALIVEGPNADRFLFCNSLLQCTFDGLRGERLLGRLLARTPDWRMVPRVVPYSLPELRLLA